MKIGDVILISFPFAEFTEKKPDHVSLLPKQWINTKIWLYRPLALLFLQLFHTAKSF